MFGTENTHYELSWANTGLLALALFIERIYYTTESQQIY